MMQLLLYLFFISIQCSMFAMGNKKQVDYDLQKKNVIASVVQQLIFEKIISLPACYVHIDNFIASVTGEVCSRDKTPYVEAQYEEFKNFITQVAVAKSSIGAVLIQRRPRRNTVELKPYDIDEKENRTPPTSSNLQLPKSAPIAISPTKERKNIDVFEGKKKYEGTKLNFNKYNSSNTIENSFRGYCPLFDLEDICEEDL